MDLFVVLKYGLGVVATIGLYSVLYKENKFYRFWEHVFLGIAAGYLTVSLWQETLYESWWLKLTGSIATVDKAGNVAVPAVPGYWAYALLLPIGMLGYLVFSKKHNWASRIPVSIIIGLWAGQQAQAWGNRYLKQVADSMRPILPNTSELFVPSPPANGFTLSEKYQIDSTVYVSQALSNLVFVFTLVSVISYFLFSFEAKSKTMKFMTTSGRWLLMVGFGAIFGSTVMMRFSLLIDQMYFVFQEAPMKVYEQFQPKPAAAPVTPPVNPPVAPPN